MRPVWTCIEIGHSKRAWIFFVLLVWTTPALAQDTARRFELGAAFASLWQNSESGQVVPSSGLSVSFGLPVARHLALETQLAWFPGSAPAGFKDQGGQALQLGVGVRGIFFENRRVSFSGLVLPGLVRFSNTATGLETTVIDLGRGPITLTSTVMGPATHFALGLGLGFDVRVNDRISARIDGLSTLYAYSGTPIPASPGLFIAFSPAVEQRWRLNAGVAYKLGPIRPSGADHAVAGTCNAGVQIAGVVLPSTAQQEIRREAGLAGFVSCRVTEHIFADGVVTTFPRDAPISNDFGGSMLHAFAGVKAGVARDRIGLFGRAAIGIVRHSDVVRAFDLSADPPSFSIGPLNTTAWQFGGVIEVYPARHWLLRIDAIDMIIPSYVLRLIDGGQNFDVVTRGTEAIALNCGVGWRF